MLVTLHISILIRRQIVGVQSCQNLKVALNVCGICHRPLARATAGEAPAL